MIVVIQEFEGREVEEMVWVVGGMWYGDWGSDADGF